MDREATCIKVPKTLGQKTVSLTSKLNLRDRELEIQRNKDFLRVPLLRQPTKVESDHFRQQGLEFSLETGFFRERQRHDVTLAEVLENVIAPHLLASLPHALDVVGDIAIIEIPSELKSHEAEVGEAILKTHRNVRTVLAKAGAVSGTYRLRDFTVIAGEPRTQTIHREFGCQYMVDVAKAYFSPRLSHEHQRVASLVQKGETVVDLFAGVGPFSVLIARSQDDVRVFALDINPDAFALLKKNILLNRVQSRVTPLLGDARQIVHDRLPGVADRVIMNLPESASEFVDVACEAVKPAGGVIYFYGFVRQPDSVDSMKIRFSESVERAGRKVDHVLCTRTVRETAPYQSQVVLDAHIV